MARVPTEVRFRPVEIVLAGLLLPPGHRQNPNVLFRLPKVRQPSNEPKLALRARVPELRKAVTV